MWYWVKTQDKLERLWVSAGLGTSQYSPRRYVGSGWREGGPGTSAWTAASRTHPWKEGRMDVNYFNNRARRCIGGFLKAMKECVCTLLHFMPSLMNCTQCFMNLFCMRLCIPLLVHWCVCLCLTKCPHDTQIQQCVNKDSASKCSISPHLQLNHRSISWNNLKKNAS